MTSLLQPEVCGQHAPERVAQRSQGERSLQLRVLHVAGLAVTLPVVALSRLMPGRRGTRRDESVFEESNRAVLTALYLV
jgi:hypothetical protein